MSTGTMLGIISGVDHNLLAILGIVVAILVAYLLLNAAYNLFVHPLRNFPGPKLAAIGPFYEFYYDVVKDGMFLWEMERLHQEYGSKS